jgi:hypothetical protein
LGEKKKKKESLLRSVILGYGNFGLGFVQRK